MSVTIRRTRTLGAVPMTEQAVWGVQENPGHRPKNWYLAALRSRPTPSGSGRGVGPDCDSAVATPLFPVTDNVGRAKKKKSLLTVTNACVLCGTTCKNKWAASDHLKRAIRHQRCVLDMTHAHVSLEPITSFSCPACYCIFGPATELQWHLRTHLEPYLTPGYLFVWPAHAVVVAGIGARAFRGRTVAATADQETGVD